MKTKTNIAAVGKPYPNMQESLPSCREPKYQMPTIKPVEPTGPIKPTFTQAVADMHAQINRLQDALEKLQEELTPVLGPLAVNMCSGTADNIKDEEAPALLAHVNSAIRRIYDITVHVEHLRTRNQL